MRIVPYFNEDDDINEIESMSIIIKAIPFEGSFVPTFFINVNSEDYEVCLDELNSLMDGLEIAMKHIDSMINWAIQPANPVEAKHVSEELLDKLLDDYDEDEEG